jgi:subtilisin family serine protease
MGRRLLVLALVLAVIAGPAGLARPAAARSIEPSVGVQTVAAPSAAPANVSPLQPRILVQFHHDATDADRARAVASVGGTIDRVLDAIGITRVALPIPTAEDQTGLAALRLARDPAVRSVEPDSVGAVAFTPNDTYYLTDPEVSVGQWGIRKAHVDQAWDTVRGASFVTVAVIDTGVDPNHPDLQGALLPGTTFLTSPDPTCAPGSTVDDNSHGTHVAGLIAANGNNGQGIAGVAFGVKILPIKALDCTGAGLLSDVATSIMWAADHGARIINISLGSNAGQQTLQDAVRYAIAHNVLVVAAAGNCGTSSTRCPSLNTPQYPGAYPETLAVAATDISDARAVFSNENSYVGIAAPGVNIWSTVPTYPTTMSKITGKTSYARFQGTSQASPFVAGVAALLLSKDPTLTPAQLTDRLKSTADDLGIAGADPDFGAGRVNALKAVSVSSVVTPSGPLVFGATYQRPATFTGRGFTVAPIALSVTITNTSNFTWSVAGTSAVHLGYHWLGNGGQTIVWDGVRSNLPGDVAAGSSVTVNATIPTLPAVGAYLLRLDLVKEGVGWFSGNGVAPLDLPVTLTNGLAASYAPTASTQSTFVLGDNKFPLTVANTGAVTWPAAGLNPVHVSYHWIGPDGSVVVWDGARAALPTDVAPGQNVVVSVPVAAPDTLGSYILRIDLVQEGVAWFSSQGVAPRDFAINVTNGFGASYAVSPLTPLQPGGRIALPVTLTNTGLATWAAGGLTPLHLAAHVFDATGQTVIWDGERTSLPGDVAPGQSVITTVVINAPAKAGPYTVKVDLVREGVAWLSSYGVAPATLVLQDIEDYRAAFQLASTQVSRAAPSVSVTVTNTSITTWSNSGPNVIDVSSHWLAADGTVLSWDGPRAALGAAVAPGASVIVTLPLATPPPGAASLVVDLVAEGLRWFGAGSVRGVTLVP